MTQTLWFFIVRGLGGTMSMVWIDLKGRLKNPLIPEGIHVFLILLKHIIQIFLLIKLSPLPLNII